MFSWLRQLHNFSLTHPLREYTNTDFPGNLGTSAPSATSSSEPEPPKLNELAILPATREPVCPMFRSLVARFVILKFHSNF